MDETQRQVMKADPQDEDESGQVGWLIAGSLPLLVGGILLLIQPNSGVAGFGGAILALIGLALLGAAIWVRAGDRPS